MELSSTDQLSEIGFECEVLKLPQYQKERTLNLSGLVAGASSALLGYLDAHAAKAHSFHQANTPHCMLAQNKKSWLTASVPAH